MKPVPGAWAEMEERATRLQSRYSHLSFQPECSHTKLTTGIEETGKTQLLERRGQRHLQSVALTLPATCLNLPGREGGYTQITIRPAWSSFPVRAGKMLFPQKRDSSNPWTRAGGGGQTCVSHLARAAGSLLACMGKGGWEGVLLQGWGTLGDLRREPVESVMPQSSPSKAPISAEELISLV